MELKDSTMNLFSNRNITWVVFIPIHGEGLIKTNRFVYGVKRFHEHTLFKLKALVFPMVGHDAGDALATAMTQRRARRRRPATAERLASTA